jgi:hypothetical protein
MKIATSLLRCSGLILVAAGLALVLTNFASTELSAPHDPIFQFSLRGLFWVMGVVLLGIGVFCVFSDGQLVPAAWLAWISVNFWIYKFGLYWNGTPRFDGVLGTLPETFGLARSTVEWSAYVAFGFILLTSGVILVGGFMARRKAQVMNSGRAIKISCQYCGGHIEFPVTRSGEQLPCPHCAKVIALKPA